MPGSSLYSGALSLSVPARSAWLASTSISASAAAIVSRSGTCGVSDSSKRLEQRLLARQRAVLRRQRLVLEGLEFRRDVALGVFQRLAAAVVVGHGHLVRLRAADFDVEAVHLVVFDLERGDAGARAFAGFQFQQEGAGVARQRAQFVEVGVVAVGDDAAFAQHAGRLGLDRACEQGMQVGAGGKRGLQRRQAGAVVGQGGRELGQQGERVAQAGEIARPRVLQRDAAADALDIGAALQQAGKGGGGVGQLGQHADGVAPPGQDFAVAQRVVQPVAQQARAHAGGGGVEHRQAASAPLRRAGFR